MKSCVNGGSLWYKGIGGADIGATSKRRGLSPGILFIRGGFRA